MRYLSQSNLWRLENLARVKSAPGGNGHSKVLGRFRQIFPLTLFPGELIIEDKRIIWMKRNGPWAEQVTSIMATDIAAVNVSCGPIFAHIHIQSLTGGPEIFVDNLGRENALRIRNLVENIALVSREGLSPVSN